MIVFEREKDHIKPGIMAHAFNASTFEAETGESM